MFFLPTTRFNAKRRALRPERSGAQPLFLLLNTRGWHNRTGRFRAQFEEPEQDLVALRCQFVNRARACLSVDTVDELALKVGRQFGRAKNLPPGGHWTGELLEKMLNSAFTTAEMVEHYLAHDAPAQPGSAAQCLVHIGNADNSFGNQVVNFTRQGSLQAVGDMSGHLFVQTNRLFSQSRVEFRSALNCFFRRFGSADDLHKRDKMGRVERMRDYAALGMGPAPDWISLMVSPDELDAMMTSGGNSSSSCP